MKKIFFILLLLIPFVVLADPEDGKYEYTIHTLSTGLARNNGEEVEYYSNTAVYENGVYKLTGNVQLTSIVSYPLDVQDGEMEVIYTCNSHDSSECTTLIAVLRNDTYYDALLAHDYYTAFILENGAMYDDSLLDVYYGTGYEMTNDGKYKLTGVQKKSFLEIDEYYREFAGNYLCSNVHENVCDEINYAFSGYPWYQRTANSRDRILFGSDFTYRNGKYVLVDTNELDPARIYQIIANENDPDHNRMYTCLSKSDTCETLHVVEDADADTDPHYYYYLYYSDLDYDFEEDEEVLVLGDNNLDISKMFGTVPVEDIKIVPEGIVQLKSKVLGEYELIPLMVGTADIIYEAQPGVYKVLHVSVVEDMLNPKTSNGLILYIIGVAVVSLLLFVYYKKMEKE